jgi:hypothetical protein
MDAGKVLVALVAAVLLAAAAWWFMPLEYQGKIRQSVPMLQGEAAGHSTSSAGSSTKIYRWKDERGQIHTSNIPPKGRRYETIELRDDTNVIPSDASN